MAFSDLTPILQEAYILDYNLKVKTIILFGWFIVSLFYVFYLYNKQEPTKYFLVGTFRASMYTVSWFYMWLFWLLYPVMIHPEVGIDNILIFVMAIYSILFFLFTTILIFNFTVLVPKFVINRGKMDITNFEENAMKSYFGNFKFKK